MAELRTAVLHETGVYQDLAESIIGKAIAAGADQADVIVAAGSEMTVAVRKGEIEHLREATSRGMGLRVFKGGRQAILHSSDLTSEAIDRLVIEALAMASVTDPDPHAGLPEEATGREWAEVIGRFDPSVADVTPEAAIELARRCEQAALEYDPRVSKSDGASFSRTTGVRALANSLGFAGAYRSSGLSLVVEAICDDADGKKRNAHWWSSATSFDRLDSPEHVGREAARRAVEKIGARKVVTKDVPVVWHPNVAAMFLGALAGAANGGRLYRRQSFLVDQEGKPIAFPLVTILDDWLLVAGLASRPFDGEGLTSRVNYLFEGGRFAQFLLDTYYARKTGRRSTHSATRGLSGPPGPGTTNLYLVAGQSTPEDIIAQVPDGLYLTDLLGSADNVTTGTFSRGAAGLWIENGQLAYPVSEINVSGTYQEMLEGIEAVGNDLSFQRSTAAPTLLMRRLTVSGL